MTIRRPPSGFAKKIVLNSISDTSNFSESNAIEACPENILALFLYF
jgi:hypothetical protein